MTQDEGVGMWGVGGGFGFVLFSDERNLGMFIDCEEELRKEEKKEKGLLFGKIPVGQEGEGQEDEAQGAVLESHISSTLLGHFLGPQILRMILNC